MDKRRLIRWVGITALLLSSASAWGQTVQPGETIGLYTAIQGAVRATHPVRPGEPQTAVPVTLRDKVLFKDIIETQEESRTKALFEDDTLLTVGANSRVEITEYIFDPDRKQRSTIIQLFKGKVRALVGKLFVQKGSKFEIHTPTAVAAARGTYMVMWIEENPGTGVANIGETGMVDFTAENQTVAVGPGEYSVALPGLPPIPPIIITPTAPPAVGGSIQGTELQDSPTSETPLEMATMSGQAPLPIMPSIPSVVAPPVVPMVVGQPVTPPAPTSGAANTKVPVTLQITLP